MTAYVKDRVLYLKGEGEVTEFGGDGAPWAEYGETLEGAYLPRRVKVPASVLATMPFSVNGAEPVLPEGTIPVSKVALEKAGVETLAIEDGTAYLGISVRTNGDLTAETASWGKVKFDEKTPVGVSEDGEDVAGYRFTSKADSSKSIFLPAAGFDIGTGRSSAGTFGYYWSATVCSPNWSGYDLNFGSSSPSKVSDNSFSYGLSVRAVRDQL